MTRKQKWWIGIGIAVLGVFAALLIAGCILARRFDPYIRQQAVEYLSKRFDSHVELKSLRVRIPELSPLRVLVMHGRGAMAHVEGEDVSLRHKNRGDVPPLLAIHKFSFNVDLGSLFGATKTVPLVTLDGLVISVPPKGQRPDFHGSDQPVPPDDSNAEASSVLIERVIVRNAKLAILPSDPAKIPLRFDIRSLKLTSAGPGVAMRYDAELTNPKPAGKIHSEGTFGPWNADEPGDTPLAGKYTFDHADLGVFSSIAGILTSHGTFEGTLDSVHARGEASVPDFRLKRSGNKVPLKTRFEVLVDGTNGNTILQPVQAMLGTTSFTTSGGIIKHENDASRAVRLDVIMPQGNLRDVLHLAMAGPTFMEGKLALKTKIVVPPLSGKVRDKLVLDGQFQVSDGHFLRSTIQDQIDSLSRRGQGQPNNEGIDEVVSDMSGSFHLADEVLKFRSLAFGVPGAWIALKGDYKMDADILDFHGTLKLKAKVSETMTGWKHWLLKPVDPFFAKNGAGTFLQIQVVGSSKAPKFGRDKGDKPDKAELTFPQNAHTPISQARAY